MPQRFLAPAGAAPSRAIPSPLPGLNPLLVAGSGGLRHRLICLRLSPLRSGSRMPPASKFHTASRRRHASGRVRPSLRWPSRSVVRARPSPSPAKRPPAAPKPGFPGPPGHFTPATGRFTRQADRFPGETGRFTPQPGRFARQPGRFARQPGRFARQPGRFGAQPGRFGGEEGRFGARAGRFTPRDTR